MQINKIMFSLTKIYFYYCYEWTLMHRYVWCMHTTNWEKQKLLCKNKMLKFVFEINNPYTFVLNTCFSMAMFRPFNFSLKWTLLLFISQYWKVIKGWCLIFINPYCVGYKTVLQIFYMGLPFSTTLMLGLKQY